MSVSVKYVSDIKVLLLESNKENCTATRVTFRKMLLKAEYCYKRRASKWLAVVLTHFSLFRACNLSAIKLRVFVVSQRRP
jgi:hypothetical protein